MVLDGISAVVVVNKGIPYVNKHITLFTAQKTSKNRKCRNFDYEKTFDVTITC